MSRPQVADPRQGSHTTKPNDPYNTHSEDEDEEGFSAEPDEDNEAESEEEKSETEEELERLVLGDSAGFLKGLKDFSLENGEDAEVEDAGRTTGLEGLDDSDLFFTDLGTVEDSKKAPLFRDHLENDQDDTLKSRYPAAWEDSDDERLSVSLASVPRLRKLRRTAAEDVVSGQEYKKRLRKQFELLNPPPKWAIDALERPAGKKRRSSVMSESEEDVQSDDAPSVPPLSELLRNSESLVRQSDRGVAKKRKLRPEVVDIQRMKDIDGIQPSSITSLSFHPRYPLLLSSGPSATLYLHHISPSPPAPAPNPLLTSMHIRGVPLSTTAFHPADGRIFLSGPNKYFHVWDLISGRVEKINQVYDQQHEQRTMERFKLSPDGEHMALLSSSKKNGGLVNILSSASLQWVSQVRIQSRKGIADFCWWRNGEGLTIVGKNGEGFEWSVKDERVVARWQDEGAVGITTFSLGGRHEIAKSPIGTDRWIAIGSISGIVNIYDRRVWLTSSKPSDEQPVPHKPKPIKTLDHLITPTSNLTFSHDGQLLAMTSRWKADAMKLVHLPSCTVFKNWPTSSTPFGRITGVAFVAGEIVGGDVHSVIAVASEQGKIRLWEIR